MIFASMMYQDGNIIHLQVTLRSTVFSISAPMNDPAPCRIVQQQLPSEETSEGHESNDVLHKQQSYL